jgi:hypothetical protein
MPDRTGSQDGDRLKRYGWMPGGLPIIHDQAHCSILSVEQPPIHAPTRKDRGARTRTNAKGPAPQGKGTDIKIESLAIGSLKPYARNARTHSKKQIRQIVKSIQRFGFCNPVVPVGNSHSDISMVEPTQDGHGHRLTDGLNGARDRRVFRQ